MESAASILECSLCLGEFQDPRALPCLHTFCFRCLSQLFIPRRTIFKCPICQEQHTTPLNGADGFRKDFRIKSFMEMNKTEGKSVRRTLCQSHPRLELTHFCPKVGCKGAVFCIQCARQKHREHEIVPMKSVCEAKLSHLKVMEEAIRLNRELVQSARKRLEDNKSEMQDILRRRLNELHEQLDQVAKNNVDKIETLISEAHEDLTEWEHDIGRAEARLRALKNVLSDTIPKIVANKELDEDLGGLRETLNNWSIKYSLLKIVDCNPFKSMNENWVVRLPSQSVKGVSVALYGSTSVTSDIDDVSESEPELMDSYSMNMNPSYYTSSDDE